MTTAGDDRRDDRRRGTDRGRDPGRRGATRRDADPSDPELADLLDELGETLEELRGDLRERGPEPPRRFRPPTPRELLRFTEEYTIPAVVATLEATIRTLELLQRALRMADPERAAREEARTVQTHLGDVSRDATTQLSRTLDDLGRALDEANLPENPEARSLVADARDLVSEIDRRVAESRRDADSTDRAALPDRREDRGARDDGPVRIDVVDEDRPEGAEGTESDAVDDSSEAGEPGATDDPDGSDAEVDVEAELESIRDEVTRGRAGEADASADEEAGPDGDAVGDEADDR